MRRRLIACMDDRCRGGKSSGPGAVEVGSPSELTKAISRLMDTVTGGDPNLLSRYSSADR